MAFNFARLKQWLGFENITAGDLNAEFNNMISKAGADTLSGANSTAGSSPTVSAMQSQENPGAVGTEVLSSTVQEDVKQLRYQLAAITGNSYWYSAPVASIADLNTSISGLATLPHSRITSGRIDANNQPMFLVPDGTALTVTLKATTTNLSTYIDSTQRVFTADQSVTSLQAATTSNNTCLVNDTTLSAGQATKTQGEYGTTIAIDTIGSAISALNGTYAGFKTGTEYFVAEVDTTNNVLKNCIRGFGFSSADAWFSRVGISNNDTITLMKLTWVFATYNSATPGIAITYNKPTVANTAPTSPAIGDYWYDLVNYTWKLYNGTSWTTQAAVFVGMCMQSGTGCVAARSPDFYRLFNPLNTAQLENLTTATVRLNRINQRVSVYGTTFSFDNTQPVWSTATSLDSGVSLTASTSYYAYVSDVAALKLSDVRPHERKFDLLGSYHPAKPWRCVGQFQTDGSSLITTASIAWADVSSLLGETVGQLRATGPIAFGDMDNQTSVSEGLYNHTLTATVAANALTVSLKTRAGTDPSATDPVTIEFRDVTAATGDYIRRQATAATSLVVANGSTLGTTSAIAAFLYVYALDNAGTVELAIAFSPYDQGTVKTTVALGGAGASTVLYSTTQRTSVPIRLLGRILITEATAGTWASAPTEISLWPFHRRQVSRVAVDTGNGHGSSSTKIRRFTNSATTGPDITYADSATLGGTFTINTTGIYTMHYSDSRAGGTSDIGFSVNSASLTTNVSALAAATAVGSVGRILMNTTPVALVMGHVSATARLIAGDVIRAHTDGGPDNVASASQFIIHRVDG